MHLPDIDCEHDVCDLSRVITVGEGSDPELESIDEQSYLLMRSVSLISSCK